MQAINTIGMIASLVLPLTGALAGSIALTRRPALAARALWLLAACGLAVILLVLGVVIMDATIGADATYIVTGVGVLSIFFAAGFASAVRIRWIGWRVAFGAVLGPFCFACFVIYAVMWGCALHDSCL
jgi:hypothetical protein